MTGDQQEDQHVPNNNQQKRQCWDAGMAPTQYFTQTKTGNLSQPLLGESGLVWYVEWAGCPAQDDLKHHDNTD